ncbi:MAG TPA: hypothetical protein VLF18_05500 [Tahibacter sp.]|uniref:hypothetical protein n=1 Tax=Tahibacter sp. TaxID=2056211 RepID=UPI002BAA5177|nr:hypothetical protein [Tahibacter sp.]HSX59634.1 hypothetical protein [Tahibacter sp.]
MDIANVIKPDVYRIVIVTMVPGFLATSPWLSGVFWPGLKLASTWKDMLIPIGLTGFAVCLIVGLILENIGSEIEVHFADKWVVKNNNKLDNWNAYLQLETDAEFVGQRYIRSFLIRFKFELSMIPALVISAAGLLASLYFNQGLTVPQTATLVTLMFTIAIWFLFAVRQSALVLAQTRELLIIALNRKREATEKPRA